MRVIDYRRFLKKRLILEPIEVEFCGVKFRRTILPYLNYFSFCEFDSKLSYPTNFEYGVPISQLMSYYKFENVQDFIKYVNNKIPLNKIYLAYIECNNKNKRTYIPEFIINEVDARLFIQKSINKKI